MRQGRVLQLSDLHASIACLRLNEVYVLVSLGHAMKAKQKAHLGLQRATVHVQHLQEHELLHGRGQS